MSYIPFPLASGRYEVGPAMRRFGQATPDSAAETGHFRFDQQLAPTLSAKLHVLQQAPGESHLVAPQVAPDDLAAALRECFCLLAAEHPQVATVEGDRLTLHHLGLRLADWTRPERVERAGEPWPELAAVAEEIFAWLQPQQGLQLLGNLLALAVQEDLSLVHRPNEGDDLLEWLHVCLPSNWAPAEKIGGSFATVHEPVVHSERLIGSRRQIIQAMIQGGPFVRYVWGIHRDGRLCHNPRIHQAPPWPEGATPEAVAETAWLRVERQTTHGFPALNRALFTIRYWVEPLTVTATDPWRRERLATALAGMSEEELRYKGLAHARDRLVAWLQAT